MAKNASAWTEAERLVDQAIAANATELSLQGLRIESLPERMVELAPQLTQLDLSHCWKLRDLSLVSSLKRLRHLNLSGCGQVSDLSALTQLSTLQHLDLRRCRQVSDLSVLKQLSALQHLDLSECDQVSDLSVLKQLSALQHLNLTLCDQVSDLSALKQLSALQRLDLYRCGQVSDLSALKQLSALQHLDLRDCRQVSDLSALKQLSALQHLYLSGCDQVSDLSALKQLSALQDLDLTWCQVSDVSDLAQLSALQHLNLSGCGQVSDLSALAQLSALQHLNLSGCSQVSDLTPLTACGALRNLHADDLAVNFGPPAAFFNSFPRLAHLSVSEFAGAPRELCEKGQSNCLPALVRWYDDLVASGPTPNTDVKVFFLGNGRAGKTQIVRRLSGHPFDNTVPSTHGVSISRFALLPASADGPALQANIWDFGGQDIYLGTHSLFLDDRAIFVLVWTPATENDGAVAEQGITLQHRRLDYWLDYVRSLVGDKAPVLVVQSQCDRESLLQEAALPTGHGFAWLRRTACSAIAEDGMERLWPELKAAARLLRERHGEVALPCSWVAIDQTLRERSSTTRVLARSEFDQLCTDRGISAPEAVLSFLHLSGRVFCRPGVFNGDVVLDQAWALDGIYAVLHRAHVLPLVRQQAGHFTRELLGLLLWDTKYSVAEQEHFMSLMVACRVCFKVTEGQYVAPDCLPAREGVQDRERAIWRDATADATATLRYAFLHDGIKRGLLCAVGEQAGAYAVYWQHGLCFFDSEAQVVVRLDCHLDRATAQARSGDIVLEVSGANADAYARKMVQSIEQGINIGQAPEVVWAASQTVAPKQQQRYDGDDESGHKQPAPFAHIQAAPRPAHEPAARPVVHVSYAWGGESEALVDQLEAKLSATCTLRRDRAAMLPGDWISKFMAEIGQSQCVLVVFSDKYLKSSYCMRELLHLYQSSLGDKAAMLERIVPIVLGDAKIDDAFARLKVVRHWKAERKHLENATQGLDPVALGATTLNELRMIRDFEHHSADMLAWVADVLMPRDAAAVSAGDFQAVVDLLQRRLKS